MNQPEKLEPLLLELNQRAQRQPGYVSTYILKSREDPDIYMVASVWDTEEDWKAWFVNPERKSIQYDIDSLIGERTFYEVFDQVFYH